MTIHSSSVRDFTPHFSAPDMPPSSDPLLMSRIYELRFQVYCLECGYLPPHDYPEQREIDEHDSGSEHFCTFNQNKELVGYVRLVRADAQQKFPLHRHCTINDDAYLPPAAETAEISRLIVRQDYRRRCGDNLIGVTISEKTHRAKRERRVTSPQILLNLWRQMYVHSQINGIRYWYAAMEPLVARSLANLMNFGFNQIGPMTNYYGMVAPYIADLRKLEAHVGSANPDLMAWMRGPEAVFCA